MALKLLVILKRFSMQMLMSALYVVCLDGNQASVILMMKLINHNNNNNNNNKNPAKVLQYFPLKPRLQRLFMSLRIASHMKWHTEDRVKDGIMKHLTNSLAWKTFDEMHPSFSLEPQNVSL